MFLFGSAHAPSDRGRTRPAGCVKRRVPCDPGTPGRWVCCREDATCIDRALYDFLMMVCGFIAEYGLIPPDGGFRIVWAEPVALIEELARAAAATRTGRVQRVYRDGMTDVEVLAAIDKLAAEHQAACRAGRAQRVLNHDVSAAVKLLEPHGFTIVPPGWRLSERDEPATAGEQPPGSLADALVRLAQANGLMLAAPPAVDATGQIRLLRVTYRRNWPMIVSPFTG